MAGAFFTVDLDVRGLEAAVSSFQLVGLEPALAAISEMLVSRVGEEFDTEGHGKWPPLAESTIARRRQNGIGAQMLKDTGRLMGSIEAAFGEDYAEAGTDVDYAVYHVSAAPRDMIPLRNFFDIPEDAFDEAAEMLINFVVSGTPVQV
jgi:phage gpG-like protein